MIAALTLPLVDTVGVGPIILALIATLVTLTTKNVRRVSVSLPLLVCFVTLIGIATWLGYSLGNENLYYDAIVIGLCVPAAYFMGLRVGFNEKLVVSVLRTLLALVVVAAMLAVMETVLGHYLFENRLFSDTPIRNSQFRGRAFFPQSLVLAVFCTSAIPLALSKRVLGANVILRSLVILALFGGILSSGSRGVAACLGICIAIYYARRMGSSRSITYFFCSAVVLVGFILLLIIAGNPFAASGTSLVTSSDGATASVQYRAELYRQVIPVLVDNPLGFGLGRVPENLITFDSSFGLLDASRTVDSEIVLVLLKFGVLGALLYVALWSRMISWIVDHGSETEYALIILLFSGVFLALESWLSLAFVIPFLCGLCKASEVGSSAGISDNGVSPTNFSAKE